jgi:hypothetical protein
VIALRIRTRALDRLTRLSIIIRHGWIEEIKLNYNWRTRAYSTKINNSYPYYINIILWYNMMSNFSFIILLLKYGCFFPPVYRLQIYRTTHFPFQKFLSQFIICPTYKIFENPPPQVIFQSIIVSSIIILQLHIVITMISLFCMVFQGIYNHFQTSYSRNA